MFSFKLATLCMLIAAVGAQAHIKLAVPAVMIAGAAVGANAHLQLEFPMARRYTEYGQSIGGCCYKQPRISQDDKSDIYKEFRCNTNPKISERASQTGQRMKEGRGYRVISNLAVNHGGDVYHGLEEYKGKVGETDAEVTTGKSDATGATLVRTRLLMQEISGDAAYPAGADYRMELGTACDNCGWWSWYDTEKANEDPYGDTWNSCSDVTVEPVLFPIYSAKTAADVATSDNLPLGAGKTVTGTIFPNVPMPAITSDAPILFPLVYANHNQIKRVEFELICPTGAGGELCPSLKPTPDTEPNKNSADAVAGESPPTFEFSAEGINTLLLQNTIEPYTINARVYFELVDYRGEDLNRYRDSTATFLVANEIYCDNPTQDGTPYQCPATHMLKSIPRDFLCGTAPGSCTDDICCNPYQTCDLYTGCTGTLQPKLNVIAANVQCGGVECDQTECCTAVPTCTDFRCPATHALAAPVVAGQCVDPAACAVTDCCVANPMCSTVTPTICTSVPGWTVSPTSATTACAGATCERSDCCVAVPTCDNPQGLPNGSLRFTCSTTPQLRTQLPNPTAIVCATRGCVADECCSPIDPNAPILPPITVIPPGGGGGGTDPSDGGTDTDDATNGGGGGTDTTGGGGGGITTDNTGTNMYPNGNPRTDEDGNPLDPDGNPLNNTNDNDAFNNGPNGPPTATDPNAKSDDDDGSSGAVIGIVVALLLLCCLLLAGLLWKKKRMKSNMLDYSGDVYRDVHAEPANAIKGVDAGDFVPPVQQKPRNVVIVESSSSESESEPSIVSSSESEDEVPEPSSEEEVDTVSRAPAMAAPMLKKKINAPVAAAPVLKKKIAAPKMSAPKMNKTPKLAVPVLQKKVVQVVQVAAAAAPAPVPVAVGAGGAASSPPPTVFLGVGAGAGGAEPPVVTTGGVAVGGGDGTEQPTEFHGVGAGMGEGSAVATKPRSATVVPKGQGRAGRGGAKASKRSNTVTEKPMPELKQVDHSVSGNLVAVMPMQYADLIKNMAKKRGVDVGDNASTVADS